MPSVGAAVEAVDDAPRHAGIASQHGACDGELATSQRGTDGSRRDRSAAVPHQRHSVEWSAGRRRGTAAPRGDTQHRTEPFDRRLRCPARREGHDVDAGIAQSFELLATIEKTRCRRRPGGDHNHRFAPHRRRALNDARQQRLMTAVQAVEFTCGGEPRTRRRPRVRHVANHSHDSRPS